MLVFGVFQPTLVIPVFCTQYIKHIIYHVQLITDSRYLMHPRKNIIKNYYVS